MNAVHQAPALRPTAIRAGSTKPAVRLLATPFRACELCTHSTARSERLMCDSPAVRLVGEPEALEAARSPTGSCGPNARHLDMPGWH